MVRNKQPARIYVTFVDGSPDDVSLRPCTLTGLGALGSELLQVEYIHADYEAERLTRWLEVAEPIGSWASAALEDVGVCPEFKRRARHFLEELEVLRFYLRAHQENTSAKCGTCGGAIRPHPMYGTVCDCLFRDQTKL